jgi:hypothetical protein
MYWRKEKSLCYQILGGISKRQHNRFITYIVFSIITDSKKIQRKMERIR